MEIHCLVGLEPGNVHHFWPFAKPYLESALRRGNSRVPIGVVRERIASGDSTLFVLLADGILVGAATAAVMDTEEGKVALIEQLGADDLGPFLDQQGVFYTWAKARGCRAVQLRGRLGWMKKLSNLFETKYICMERKL